MGKLIGSAIIVAVMSVCAFAQGLNFNKALDAGKKGLQSFTLSDEQVIAYTNEYMVWMDDNNPVCTTSDKDAGMKAAAQRLEKIVSVVPADLIKQYNLNFKVYWVVDMNAFAAANGDIRVFAALMEEMTDDQILAVIGHEIGHIVNNDSKDAMVTALRASALRDVASAAGNDTVKKLSSSDLGDLAESLANAQFSQKQESAADAYGYEFLKKCGKDPKQMASALGVLLKMQEQAGSAGNSTFDSLFSSHPDLKKRISTLEKMK